MDNPKKGKFCLKKESILHHRRIFENIFLLGRRVGSKYFQVVYGCDEEGRKKIAVILGRKFGKATLRNKMRRRIKEIYRLNEEEFPPARDYIIIPRKAAQYAAFHELRDDLLYLMKTNIK